MNIAILYGSNEGHTVKVAKHIVQTIQDDGQNAEAFNLKSLPNNFDLSQYDAVMVGASIHAGNYQTYVSNWVRDNLNSIRSLPNAFFSVCLTQKDTDFDSQTEVRNYIASFSQLTGWEPDTIGSFAGALPYTEYGFFKRFLMKQIVGQQGDDSDTSRDYDYTDWHQVGEFARQFIAMLKQSVVEG
jgi:menaquinone-dependent protoporphyrinogen oxidase